MTDIPSDWRYSDSFGPECYHSVVLNNEYRLPESFSPEDVILDVGANIGAFTLACLNRGAGRVLAVEPNPEMLPLLLHNVGLDPRVRLLPAAAWICHTTLSLYFPPYANRSGGGRVRAEDSGLAVNAVPFNEILREAKTHSKSGWIRLLKLDCEGSEWDILPDANLCGVVEICGEYHLDRVTHGPEKLDELLAGFYVTREPYPEIRDLGHFWARRTCQTES